MTLALGLLGAFSSASAGEAGQDAKSPLCLGGYAPSFKLAGAVQNRKTFELDTLKQYVASKEQVTFFAGKSGLVTQSYIGVSLLDLVQQAGVILDPARKNDSLRKYIVVTGSDCYQVILSLAEILSDFGGQQVLVAYALGNGQPLTDEGMARLVVPGDKKGGRYVSNIVRISVRSAP